jgi:hypothetical protein
VIYLISPGKTSNERLSAPDLSQATDFFDGDADAKVKEIRNWLVQKGVRDFEPVTLYTDQLKKVRK